ncbi:ABC transporter ATP-binding protein [Microbulbifer thermotolerans]|uniref:ABC transporter ATP-binding protein n=1 Tax=Microbulbifer thermotolerans TaxID=252514 RepID=A0AB35HVP5_MICTH|nr:ABC transporter ATP-binding protein [Microbulbifer thermotolerans]MCX2794631.1 ABC transporter ATP-binding protein [Microbulbifer thermotolerans]MCX2801459.1 ABC transporter ATP-binding protein [Microbulbifer thermotolerans]WKT59268.1 ABC transporter ATP-binding protein [Microbulbifer thermotolerans]
MTAALSIRNLEKTYDNGFRALKGISFEVQPGDFFALLGPNGAGKSTTIGIICSLVRKTGGQVSIFGIDIDRDFPAAKRLLGVVPQEFNFSQFEKVYDIVCTQGGFYGMPRKLAAARTEKYLKQLDLWDKRGVQARMLSGGMKRRLMIARALIHEPELLILDEPTAGVDIELRRSMWTFLEEINRQGTTIILTTHYLEEAESLCRNIAIIDKGDIVENTSIKSLLKTLNRETFILDSAESLSKCPELGKFEGRLIDENSLEVTIEKGQSLNALFATLEEQGVAITSMRNRANRLEELFVSLLAEGKQAEDNK